MGCNTTLESKNSPRIVAAFSILATSIRQVAGKISTWNRCGMAEGDTQAEVRLPLAEFTPMTTHLRLS